METTIVQYLEEARSKIDAPALTSWALIAERAHKKAAALVQAGEDGYRVFKVLNGWVHNVLKRHKYCRVRSHGTCDEIDPQAADTAMTKFRAEFQALGIGNPKAIFNADETGLFFK